MFQKKDGAKNLGNSVYQPVFIDNQKHSTVYTIIIWLLSCFDNFQLVS